MTNRLNDDALTALEKAAKAATDSGDFVYVANPQRITALITEVRASRAVPATATAAAEGMSRWLAQQDEESLEIEDVEEHLAAAFEAFAQVQGGALVEVVNRELGCDHAERERINRQSYWCSACGAISSPTPDGKTWRVTTMAPRIRAALGAQREGQA